ncbi:hypothetical protein Ae263Ps1_5448 [Pseudonocardia sp. Ae263_Ps1]|nr:hypothetical protein Ae263Ps1_5448 [Pseudonocardia sp. Ae263_Ps1]
MLGATRDPGSPGGVTGCGLGIMTTTWVRAVR